MERRQFSREFKIEAAKTIGGDTHNSRAFLCFSYANEP